MNDFEELESDLIYLNRAYRKMREFNNPKILNILFNKMYERSKKYMHRGGYFQFKNKNKIHYCEHPWK